MVRADPEVEQKVLVCAAQTHNEVVLECANGSFSSIPAVNVGWDELIVHFFHSKGSLGVPGMPRCQGVGAVGVVLQRKGDCG